MHANYKKILNKLYKKILLCRIKTCKSDKMRGDVEGRGWRVNMRGSGNDSKLSGPIKRNSAGNKKRKRKPQPLQSIIAPRIFVHIRPPVFRIILFNTARISPSR